MMLPDYWLQRPAMNLDGETRSAFDHLLTQLKSNHTASLIDYTFAAPKWQFLCYAADHHGIAMHGTGDPDIRVFEPRQSNDLNEFGNQVAVYAAGDGLWAMFFAIVDRGRVPSVTNACIRLVDASGQASEAHYIFSISHTALPLRPWRTGSVYLLPPDSFVVQPPLQFGPYEVRIPHLASKQPVIPLARLEISPDDFPFLAQIGSHDDARLQEYASALQSGGPWPD